MELRPNTCTIGRQTLLCLRLEAAPYAPPAEFKGGNHARHCIEKPFSALETLNTRELLFLEKYIQTGFNMQAASKLGRLRSSLWRCSLKRGVQGDGEEMAKWKGCRIIRRHQKKLLLDFRG